MKHKIIPAVIIALLIGCFLCGAASAAISGSGSSWSDPYVINTADDLRQLSGDGYAAFTRAGYFVLNDDIEFGDNDAVFVPIGSNTNKFIGHFNGQNHKIIGLKVNSNPAGLFSYVSSGASFSNIEFHNVQIKGGGGGTGTLYGICSLASDAVTIDNVHIYDSKLSSSVTLGGMVGMCAQESNVVITSCSVNGCVITGSNYVVGGMVGTFSHTSSNVVMTSCVVKDCVITSPNFGYVGGIGGYASYANSQATVQSCRVENCYIYGKLTQVGGFFGYDVGSAAFTITDCEVLKSTIISDTSHAGGICGRGTTTSTISRCEVTDCAILAPTKAGGIIGGS